MGPTLPRVRPTEIPALRAKVAICVNPMSGRDVRRIAARASNMTIEAKRDIVARIAAGADAAGATDLYITEEPFRIASMALEWLPLQARVHVHKTPLSHDAGDTEAAVAGFLDAGATTVVSLGGDGTNRAIARHLHHAGDEGVSLIPLSTGTNNVFPTLVEPTIAGTVAGLCARRLLGGAPVRSRCKMLHVRFADGKRDVGLIDAAQIDGDFVGNFLPFDPERISRILLTRAEPDAIGMSPIGGLIDVVGEDDDCGLLLELGAGQTVNAPVSPGLFREVRVARATRVPFDTPVIFHGHGVLALDGDRDHRLRENRTAHVTVRRDGPHVLNVGAAMRHAVRHGMMASRAN